MTTKQNDVANSKKQWSYIQLEFQYEAFRKFQWQAKTCSLHPQVTDNEISLEPISHLVGLPASGVRLLVSHSVIEF